MDYQNNKCFKPTIVMNNSLGASEISSQKKALPSYSIIYCSSNPKTKRVTLTFYDKRKNQIAYNVTSEITFNNQSQGVKVFVFKLAPKSFMNNLLTMEIYEEQKNDKQVTEFKFFIEQEAYFPFLNSLNQLITCCYYICLSDLEKDSFWNYLKALLSIDLNISSSEFLNSLIHIFSTTSFEEVYKSYDKSPPNDNLFFVILSLCGKLITKDKIYEENQIIYNQSTRLIQMLNNIQQHLTKIKESNSDFLKENNAFFPLIQNAFLFLLFMDSFLGEAIFINEFLINSKTSSHYKKLKLIEPQTAWRIFVNNSVSIKKELNSPDDYNLILQAIKEYLPIEHFCECLMYIVPSKEQILETLYKLKSKFKQSLNTYVHLMKEIGVNKKFQNMNKDNFKRLLKHCDFMFTFAPSVLLDFDDSLLYITAVLESFDISFIDSEHLTLVGKQKLKIYSLAEIADYLTLYHKHESIFINKLQNNMYLKITEFLINTSIPYNKKDHTYLKAIFQNPTTFKWGLYLETFFKNINITSDDFNIVFQYLFAQVYDILKNNNNPNNINVIINSFFNSTRYVLHNDNAGFPSSIELFFNFFSTKHIQLQIDSADYWNNVFTTINKSIYYTILPNKILPNENSYNENFEQPFKTYVNNLTDINVSYINDIIQPFCMKSSTSSLFYILANNRTTENFIITLLDKAAKHIDVNEHFHDALIAQPSNDHYWYLCLSAKGKFIKFKEHTHLQQVSEKINTLYGQLNDNTLLFKDGLLFYQSTQKSLNVIISYFTSVITNTKETDIRTAISTFIERFKKKYEKYIVFISTVSKFNFYFSSDTKKKFTDLNAKFVSDEFRNKQLKDFVVEPLVEKYYNDFMEINMWSESIAFMKNTEIELQRNNDILSQGIGSFNEEQFKETMQNNIRNIKCLFEKVVNASSIKFSSTFLTLYEDLKNKDREYDVISKIFKFNNDNNKKTFQMFLQSFINFQNEMSFVKAMHKLNGTVQMQPNKDNKLSNKIRKSQTRFSFRKHQEIETDIYTYFLSFIIENDKDTSSTQQIDFDSFTQAITDVISYKDKIFISNNIHKELKEQQIKYVIDFINVYCDNINLIHFLSSKKSNELHSMIDLIDDQSDDILNMQIILNLINIKTFLSETNTEFIDDNVQTTNNKVNVLGITEQVLLSNLYKDPKLHEIINYIIPCAELFPSIERLYCELANKETSSTLKIKEILTNSKVVIDEHTIHIVIKEKRKLNEKEIFELKDRCLLFANAEQDNTLFISLAVKIGNLKNILKDMALNGYPLQIKKEIGIQWNNIQPLTEFLDQIKQMKIEWDKTLEKCFRKYYPLTLYHGSQFWEIEKWFSGNDDNCGESLLMRIGSNSNSNEYLNSLRNLNINNNNDINIKDYQATPEERFNAIGEKLMAFINNDIQSIYNKNNTTLAREQIPILLDMSVKAFYDGMSKASSTNDNDNDDSTNTHINQVDTGITTTSTSVNTVNNIIFATVPEIEGNVYHYILSIYLSYQHSLPTGAQILFCDASITYHHLITFLYRATFFNNANTLFTLVCVEQLQFDLQVMLLKFLNEYKDKDASSRTNWSICLITCEEFSYITSQLSEWNNVYKMQSMEVFEMKTIISLLKDNNFLNTVMFTSDLSGNGKSYTIDHYKADEDYEYHSVSIQDELDMTQIVNCIYNLNHTNTNHKKKIHMIVRGLIKNYKKLDTFLFSYLFLDELIIFNDIYYCYNNPSNYIICLEVANDISINDSKVLQLMPDKMHLSFNGDNFHFPEDTNSYQYQNMLYFLNYCVLHSASQLEEFNVTPSQSEGVSAKWQSEFTIDEARSIINNYIIKYQIHRQMTFRQLWIYLNFMGSQLFELSNSESLQSRNTLNKFNGLRSMLFESLLISCEEFSMNKNIISWTTMQNKYILLIHERLPMCTVHEEVQLLPDVYNEYQNFYKNFIGDYNKMKHEELVSLLKKYYQKNKDDDDITSTNTHTDNNFTIINDTSNEHYVLTPDNFLKMILIIQRVLAKVPIILIGETGCGKTSLIRFLAKEILNEDFHVLNIHSGITHNDIQTKITDIINSYANTTNTNNKTKWIFLDELNTCNHLGFLSEIICEHKMNGKPLPNDFYFIGASNPYQHRSTKRFYNDNVHSNSNKKNELVYKVNKFPNNINDYIWDYGELPEKQAEIYIVRMLSDLHFKSVTLDTVSRLISYTHVLISIYEPIYMVSLRDIARFKQIYNWFMSFLQKHIKDKLDLKCLIMTLFVCYYIKLSTSNYRYTFLQSTCMFLKIDLSELCKHIKTVQDIFISNLDINPIYAKNTALIENLFTLVLSVYNRIPLFICGKPGNSKTLSVQIITSNFRGRDSKHPQLKSHPKLIPVYYQGSEASTSEGIQKAFDKATSIAQNDKASLPIVIFDEIGLAEISPSNPLKILHSLFDYTINDNMCFVGISNWALDASKMSRVLYLARPEPSLEDLILTGKTLYNTMKNDKIKSINSYHEMQLIVILSEVYFNFKLNFGETNTNINEDFYGIRDYYSLIKKVVFDLTVAAFSGVDKPLKSVMKSSICRNFGGIPGNIEKVLTQYNNTVSEHTEYTDLQIKDFTYNTITLIRENIQEITNQFDYIPRYLLLFTNNNPNTVYLLNHYLNSELSSYKVIIGSKYKRDIEQEDYIFKVLNEIILNMEKGTCIVLKDLNYVYGALYDLFNQNFSIIGNRKNCRVALGGTNNPMCYVHDSFRCIVISDDFDLPPPFLNRFEKQLITYEHIISKKHNELYKEVINWLHNELLLDESLCELCFVGYDKENFLYGIIINNYDKYERETAQSTDTPSETKQQQQQQQVKNEDKLKLNIRKEIIQLANMNFSLGIAINEDNLNKTEIHNVLQLYYSLQCHTSFSDFHEKYKSVHKYVVIYTYSNILDNVSTITKAKLNVISLSEIQNEHDLINRFKLKSSFQRAHTASITERTPVTSSIQVLPSKDVLVIKIDYKKEQKHLDHLIFKLKENIDEIEEKYSNVYLLIYISSAKDKITINPFSDFYNITIDNINGSKDNYDKTKELLTVSSKQLIQKYFNHNVFNEFLTKIIFNLNYTIVSTEHKYIVSNHIMKLLSLFKNENFNYFSYIHNTINNIIRMKPIGDWKKFVIDQRKNYPIYNMYKVIKSFIYSAVSDTMIKLFIHIEINNSLELYLNNEKLFKQFFDAFAKNNMKLMRIKPHTEIFHCSSYKFPFSIENILGFFTQTAYPILKILDNNVLKNPSCANSDNMRNDFQVQINNLVTNFKNACYIVSDNYNLSLTPNDIANYVNDIFICYLCEFLKQRQHIDMFFSFIYTIGQKVLPISSVHEDKRYVIYYFIFLSKNKEQFNNIFTLFTKFINAKLNIQTLLKDIINDILTIDNSNCYHNNQRRVFIEKQIFSIIYSRSIKFIFANFATINISNYTDIMSCFDNTESASFVEGNEHFYDFLHFVYCAMNKFNINQINFNADKNVNSSNNSNSNEYEYMAVVVKQIVQHVYMSPQHKDVVEICEKVILMKAISKEIKGQIMLIACNNEKLLQYSNALCYYYFHKAINVINENVNNFECMIKSDTFNLLCNFFNQIRDFNEYKKMFFIEHFMLYLSIPREQKEIETYLMKEHSFMLECVKGVSNNNNNNGGSGVTQRLQYVLYIAFLKHYFLVYAMAISNLSLTSYNINDIEQQNEVMQTLNQCIIQHSSCGVINNCKFYVLKNITLLRKLPLTQIIDDTFETKTYVTWVNRAQLENDANVLALTPVLDVFNDEYKECETLMSNVIKDGGQDTSKTSQFLTYITSSVNNYKKKFSILNYIISNLYISYTINNFESSSTYKNIIKLFAFSNTSTPALTELQQQIHSAFKTAFTRPNEFNFILALLSNFTAKDLTLDIQPTPEFTLTPNTQNIGLLLFTTYIYALTISFADSSTKIFTQLFNDLSSSLTNIYFPGNIDHPLDCIRFNIINDVINDFKAFGKSKGLYECECGYLYTIGNCTRPEDKSDCMFCSNFIGGKSHHKLVDTSTVLINVDNKKGVTQEGLLHTLREKFKRERGYIYHDNFSPLRDIDKNNVLFFSMFIHSMLLLKLNIFNDVFYGKHIQKEYDNIPKQVKKLKESYAKSKTKRNETDEEIENRLKGDIITLQKYIHNKLFNAYKEFENGLGTTDVYILLFIALEKLIMLTEIEEFDFSNYESRNVFENTFAELSKTIFDSAEKHIQEYKHKHNIELSNMFLKILSDRANTQEINEYDKDMLNEYIFFTPRSQFQPSWQSICENAFAEPDKYKYISILNKYSDQIDMMQNLFPISKVSNRMLNKYNAKLSRNDGKESKLLNEFGSDDNEEWKNFECAWKNISHGAVQYKCKILPKLPSYELELNLAFLLCDDKEPGFGMYLACAYEFLGKTQNEIIEEVTAKQVTTTEDGVNVDDDEENEDKESLEKYPIQSLTPKEVLHFDSKLINIYEKFFSVFTFTKERKVMECDYDKINLSIKDLLTDPMIKMIKYDQLNVIQYTNELLSFNDNQHSNFINVIKNAVTQYKITETQVLTQIDNTLNSKGTYDTENLYSNIELLCCQLKYENNISPKQTLREYIINSDKRQNYALLEQWNVTCDIRIEHIIDFYEIVEEKMFDCVVELISPDYKEPFEDRVKQFEDFKEKFGDDDGTIVPKLIYVIKALKKFVVRGLRTDIEKTFVLKHNLVREDFWNENDGVTEENVEYLIGYFPEDILIAHTFSTLDVLIELYNKKHMTKPLKRVVDG